MKAIHCLIFLTLFISCNENKAKFNHENEKKNEYANEYASHFSILRNDSIISINSAGSNFNINKNYSINKIIITCSSAFAFLNSINKKDKITGVTSPENFFNSFIKENIDKNNIQIVGTENELNFEKIMILKPDLIITYPNSNYQNTLSQLKNKGIKILYIEEYKETHPLAKTEYLKLFGLIFNKEKAADSLYSSIKNNYCKLKKETENISEKPTVLTNIMYGDIWHLPEGNSLTAKLLNDSGADYLWKGVKGENSFQLGFENVFSKAKDADFWVGVSVNSQKLLLESNTNYKHFKAFKENKIYSINSIENNGVNDYYESGVIYSDIILSDFIKIFHPDILPDYKIKYLKNLEN